MRKILAFAGTNSKLSINKQLVTYASSLIKEHKIEIIDLNDFELPVFSIDLEKEKGFPENALRFSELIKNSKGVILSLAEHNGTYTAAFKNLFDWLSRIEAKTWQHKPMLLMSATPGGRGGQGVLAAALDRFPRHDSNIVSTFSLPNFHDNFESGEIIDEELIIKFKEVVRQFTLSI